MVRLTRPSLILGAWSRLNRLFELIAPLVPGMTTSWKAKPPMRWNFCIDTVEKRALNLCHDSMNKDRDCCYGYGYGGGSGDGYSDGYGDGFSPEVW